ncbi:MAG: SpoIIE family protein phosphatase [Odoribacter sp.]|nr:SpoIIE family protein phosphatase [Odoribacter sp.]
MKLSAPSHFSRQLIFYLFLVLVSVFGLILWILTHSVNHFISNNAYTQTQIFAENIPVVFEKEILHIESIPDNIIKTSECHNWDCLSDLPERLLIRYPQLIGCSLHGNLSDPDTTAHRHLVAIRENDGKIKSGESRYCLFRPPTQRQIIRQSECGCWIYSTIRQERTLAFCYPLYDTNSQPTGFLKLDFPQKAITDLICNGVPEQYGKLFILDSSGNYLVSPSHPQNLPEFPHTPYFIHYAPIPCLNWQLGIECPSCPVLNACHQLHWIVLVCLGGGLLFLFIGIANIVRRHSSPLKQLTYAAHRIAEGDFDTPIPSLKYSYEINELCNAFRYLQHNLTDYIEKLKISATEKEQRNSEMKLAQRIQQRFLPHNIALPPHIQLAAELRQSREVGGDLYEFFLQDDRLYFAIGDVSGKGIPAALYMVSVSRLLRYVACSQTSTAPICDIINKHLCEDDEDDMYLTLFLGILDLRTGVLTYTNAGHPYPLILNADGTTCSFTQYPDIPIGILDNYHFTEHTYTFPANSSLLFYTDGITDAENPDGQFFGKEKLIKCVERVATDSPRQIIQAILEDISKHMDSCKQTDDLTLLLIRFAGIS